MCVQILSKCLFSYLGEEATPNGPLESTARSLSYAPSTSFWPESKNEPKSDLQKTLKGSKQILCSEY